MLLKEGGRLCGRSAECVCVGVCVYLVCSEQEGMCVLCAKQHHSVHCHGFLMLRVQGNADACCPMICAADVYLCVSVCVLCVQYLCVSGTCVCQFFRSLGVSLDSSSDLLIYDVCKTIIMTIHSTHNGNIHTHTKTHTKTHTCCCVRQNSPLLHTLRGEHPHTYPCPPPPPPPPP